MRKLQLVFVTLVFVALMGGTALAAVPTFTFNGDGYGHGVGMSQLGAVSRANQGQNYQYILGQYFKGTSIQTRSELSPLNAVVNLDASKAARSSWTIRPSRATSSFQLNSTTARYGDALYTFKVEGGKIRMYKGSTLVRTIQNSAVNIIADTRLLEVNSTSGPFSRQRILYRGYLRLQLNSARTQLYLYNYVPVQQYLYGVVPRELGASYYKAKPDASKVQAICARSYAYKKITNGSVLACTTSDQVYGGYGRWAKNDRSTFYSYEEAASNSAIDATNNMCVTYGGSVITTYFSSCNGSHTANAEDIWGTAYPYLVGVAEPSYAPVKWTVSVDGMALATTFKNKGAWVPSGAGSTVYVSKLDPTYGQNGWVKALKVYWSNGQTSSIDKGDNVRIRLGLKSAHFSVTSSADAVSAPTASGPIVTVQDPDYSVRRYGSWSKLSSSRYSGGSSRSSKTINNYVMVKFKGTGISWIGTKGPGYGRAKIYVDGAHKATINTARSTTAYRQNLYTITGLNAGSTHTLKIVVTTKSGSTGAGTVNFDAAQIYNGRPLYYLTKTAEENSSLITHSTFRRVTNAQFSGGAAYRTVATGKSLKFAVKAQNFSVYCKKSAKGGRFKVYINGRYIRTVDLKSATTSYGKVYSRNLVPSKRYVIKLVSTTASGSSRAGTTIFDCIKTYDGKLVR